MMMQRRDEIQAKKAKLAELRRQREEREQRQKEFSKRDSKTEPPDVIPSPSRSHDPQELEKILSELIPEKQNLTGAKSTEIFSSSPQGSRPSSILGSRRAGINQVDRDSGSPSRDEPTKPVSVATQTLSAVPVSTNFEYLPTPAPIIEVVSYSKAVQTSDQWSSQRQSKLSSGFSDSDSDRSFSITRTPRSSKRLSRRERDREEEIRQKLRKEIEEELNSIKSPNANESVSRDQPKYPSRALSGEELNAVISSTEFLEFVERSSKVIERALDYDYDVLADYAQDGLEGLDGDEDEGYGSSRGKMGKEIRQVAQYYDERWSRKRMISDLDFSPKFPELLLASYTKNPSAPQDPSGVLHIWNMHLHSRPEYTFNSTSDILTARFSPFHPCLILGGSYSGQVLLWDTRSKSSMPVQKTPLTGASSGGHTHPVYSLSLVGTQNANNIISCSTDGVVCGWTVDMLSQPQEYLELIAPAPSKTEDLSPTCMQFPASDPTSFVVGTEEGTIYSCHRYDRAGAKAGVDSRIRYKGHTAPVMSLNFHPVRGPVDLGDLLLSSSLDWTVKLWKIRPPSSTSITTSSNSNNPNSAKGAEHAMEPLFEFSREDVIYDARWSPHKPGVFSLVDGTGTVEVWDLTSDFEVPVAKATPEVNRKVIQTTSVAKSLNKVVWEEKEGKKLAVGGAAAVVTVFEVGSELANEGARGEEWTAMKRLVGRVEAGKMG